MPDIQTLTSKVQQLESAHGFWSTWSVYFIALTLVATALYLFAQWMTNKTGNELSEVQAALIRAKDAQLVSDLKDKDLRIGEANDRAGTANEGAAKANERASGLELRAQNLARENLEIRSGVADLEKEAADAKRKQAEAELRLTGLASRQQRQELPRWVYLPKLYDLLKGKAKGIVDILYVRDDNEAHEVAYSLARTLSSEGWVVVRVVPISEDDPSQLLPAYSSPNLPPVLKDAPPLAKVGGQVGITLVANKLSLDVPPFNDKKPFDVLMEALLNCGFNVQVNPNDQLPDGFIRVVVGQKS